MTTTLEPVPRVHVENQRTDDSLSTLRARLDLSMEEAETIRRKLHARVLEALAAGEHPSAVARSSGYTRQRLHQMRAETQ